MTSPQTRRRPADENGASTELIERLGSQEHRTAVFTGAGARSMKPIEARLAAAAAVRHAEGWPPAHRPRGAVDSLAAVLLYVQADAPIVARSYPIDPEVLALLDAADLALHVRGPLLLELVERAKSGDRLPLEDVRGALAALGMPHWRSLDLGMAIAAAVADLRANRYAIRCAELGMTASDVRRTELLGELEQLTYSRPFLVNA